MVVANHCSYLDGVVLAASLPTAFSFVIKREMASVPLAGLLLRRIGAEFVERRDQGRVLRDTRRLLRQALSGHALVFFPEGTFSHVVEHVRFCVGALCCRCARQSAGGTHSHPRHPPLSGARWRRPRPGPIEVQMLAWCPRSSDEAWGMSRALRTRPRLRDQARRSLAATGEPDLNSAADSARMIEQRGRDAL